MNTQARAKFIMFNFIRFIVIILVIKPCQSGDWHGFLRWWQLENVILLR